MHKSGRQVFRRIQLLRTIRISLAWFVAGVFQAGYDFLLLKSKELSLNVLLEMLSRGLVGLAGGFISGLLILHVFNKQLRRFSYGWIIVSTMGIYLILMLLISLPASWLYFSISLDETASVPERMWTYISGYGYLKDLVFWGFIILITVISVTIQDKYGPGTLRNLILGKYHRATRENRIFMFLDMKDSTTIAERLGEEKFFNLIADCFEDATNPILWNKGQIYQYIGDEIVITWPLKDGLEDVHFLRCFFDIQKALEQRRSHYENEYGLMPAFKAGAHEGLCITGEMGVIKKEISHYGDVLNTTARIQGKCNDFEANFLVSESLLEISGQQIPYRVKRLGDVELKGKVAQVAICSVTA
jgi:adenylate cyclase